MAKRVTQFYAKQSQNTFSQPIKMGTSAQYVTMEETDNAETLKDYCSRIGDPSNLTANQSVEVQDQKNIVTVLNETSQKADQALAATTGNFPDNSIGQEKLKPITFSDADSTSEETVPVSGSTLSKLFSIIKRSLNSKLKKEGDTLGTTLLKEQSYFGVNNGLGIKDSDLVFKQIQGENLNFIPVIKYDNDIGLVTEHKLWNSTKESTTLGEVYSDKYGDGRLIVSMRIPVIGLELSTSMITPQGQQYLYATQSLNIRFPDPFTSFYTKIWSWEPLIGQSSQENRTVNIFVKCFTTSVSQIKIFVPEDKTNTNNPRISGFVNIYLQGRWKN